MNFTKKRKVGVIDYGMGNIWSVKSAFDYLGSESIVISDPDDLLIADCLILPGVGSFKKAMEALKSNAMDESILYSVKKRGKKILGICLGMQLLGSLGTEDGNTKGLGLISNKTVKFFKKDIGNLKIPHVGFNSIEISSNNGIFLDLPEKPDFYFVHSYRMLPEELEGNFGICKYGIDFLAAFEKENISGTQFHPEKSQTNGLKLLNNFLHNVR